MKYYLLPFLLSLTTLLFGQNDSLVSTQLTIVQGTDSTLISKEVNSIIIKAQPFKLIFHTLYSDAVYLNCSFDSTSYIQVINNQMDSITCFNLPQTFSEEGKNYNHNITVVNYVNRGYHCLYAYSEDEQFVRFDSVAIKNKNNWIGTRTVGSIYILPKIGITALSTLVGKQIFFVFSPGLEKYGHALKILFE